MTSDAGQHDTLTVGIDIGGTKMAAGVVDDAGDIVARLQIPTPTAHGDELLAAIVETALGFSRTHVQRGGSPSAFDRWLATRFGLNAIQAVTDGDFGTMVALRGTEIVRVPLSEGTAELKLVRPDLYEEVEVLFG